MVEQVILPVIVLLFTICYVIVAATWYFEVDVGFSFDDLMT